MSEVVRNHRKIVDTTGKSLARMAFSLVTELKHASRAADYNQEQYRKSARIDGPEESEHTREYRIRAYEYAQNVSEIEAEATGHYQANQAAYVQHAYEDATAQGRTINYPGADPIPGTKPQTPPAER